MSTTIATINQNGGTGIGLLAKVLEKYFGKSDAQSEHTRAVKENTRALKENREVMGGGRRASGAIPGQVRGRQIDSGIDLGAGVGVPI